MTDNALVFINNDTPLTTSLIVAEQFDKTHKHVLEAIENLIADMGSAQKSANSPPPVLCQVELCAPAKQTHVQSVPVDPRRLFTVGNGFHGQKSTGVQTQIHRSVQPHGAGTCHAANRTRRTLDSNAAEHEDFTSAVHRRD